MTCEHVKFAIMLEQLITDNNISSPKSLLSVYGLALFFPTLRTEKEKGRCSPCTKLVSTHSILSLGLTSLKLRPSPFFISAISSFPENILASHCFGPFLITNSEDKYRLMRFKVTSRFMLYFTADIFLKLSAAFHLIIP